jgi:hypothetical protein
MSMEAGNIRPTKRELKPQIGRMERVNLVHCRRNFVARRAKAEAISGTLPPKLQRSVPES